MLTIKNVILYDPYGAVVGFVELKNIADQTVVRIKHNITDDRVVTTINGQIYNPLVQIHLDLAREINIAITQTNGNTTTVVASGSINTEAPPATKVAGALKSILQDTEQGINRETVEEYRMQATREIDEVLRAICRIDDKGKGMCECCPYRDYFFGENVNLDTAQ